MTTLEAQFASINEAKNSVYISKNAVDTVIKKLEEYIVDKEIKRKMPPYVIFRCIETSAELF